jgi:hypothetical protein
MLFWYNWRQHYVAAIQHDWRGLGLGPPFDGEIIPPKLTRHSNTINNVKAKIDNVKAKIQDKEERRPWSRPTLARRPVFGQLVASRTSSPLEEPPRQAPPRTTSLRFTRQVRSRLARGPRRTARAPPPTRVEERISTPWRYNSWRPCRRPAPIRALMLVWPAAQPSHRHHLLLRHTQAQPEALKHPLRHTRA